MERITRWVLGKLSSLRTGSEVGILFIEKAEDTGGDLAADDSFFVLAHNVGTEHLIECRCGV